MRIFTLILCLLSLSGGLYCQSTWHYYGDDKSIDVIEVVNDIAYVGNESGLYEINIESGESQLLHSPNCDMRGSDVTDILPGNGYLWIDLRYGGIAKYWIENDASRSNRWEQFYPLNPENPKEILDVQILLETDDGTLWLIAHSNPGTHLLSLKNGEFTDHSSLVPEGAFINPLNSHGHQNIFFSQHIQNEERFGYIDVHALEISMLDPIENTYGEINSVAPLNDVLYAVAMQEDSTHTLLKYVGGWEYLYHTNESLSIYNASQFNDELWMNISLYNEAGIYRVITDQGYRDYTFDELTNGQVEHGNSPIVKHVEENGKVWMINYDKENYHTHVYSMLGTVIDSFKTTHTIISHLPHTSLPVSKFDCDGNYVVFNDSSNQLQIFNTQHTDTISFVPQYANGNVNVIWTDTATCLTYAVQQFSTNDDGYLYTFNEGELVNEIKLKNTASGAMLIYEGKFYMPHQEGLAIYDLSDGSYELITTLFFDAALLQVNRIISAKAYPDGTLMFGNIFSLVTYSDGNWTRFDSTNSPFGIGTYISKQHIDQNGHILIPEDNGFHRFDGNNWEFITVFESTDIDAVICIYELDNGDLLLGTYYSGILHWREGFIIDEINLQNSALPTNKVFDITVNPVTGDFWLAHAGGLSIWDKDDYDTNKGIYGKAYFDENQNKTYDIGVDVGIKNVSISTDEKTVLTDVNGNYAIYPESNEEIAITCNDYEDFNFIDNSQITVDFQNEDIFDVNFGLLKELEPQPINVDITTGPFLCSSEVSIWMTIQNSGWSNISGEVTLEFPEEAGYISSYPTGENMSNSVTWQIDELGYLEERQYSTVLQVHPVEEVLENHEDIDSVFYNMTAKINYDDIIEESEHIVQFVCSYDPNDKLVTPLGPSKEEFTLLDNDLLYTVRFQNEGNYKASSVVIIDTISQLLDIRTLKIIANSHPMEVEINDGRVVTFRFNNIDLPPQEEDEAGSQGFVKFRISPKENIADNTTITNNAGIYFDHNSPIITNTVENILVEELPKDPIEGNNGDLYQFSLFPNPTSGSLEFTISSSEPVKFDIYNIYGQLISSGMFTDANRKTNLEYPGIYFIHLHINNSTYIRKVFVHT